MYTRPFYINCSDVDEYKHLKPSGIFKLFQDTTVPAVEETQYGAKWLDDHQLMWVITHVRCDIIRMPRYQEEVDLITYPCPNMKIIYPRHFFIKDKDGNFLVKMSTTWALLDKNTRTFASLPEGPLDLNTESHPEYQLDLPRRIRITSEGTLKDERLIRYSDCDLNTHLNNTRYIDFIFDLFDASFYKSHRLSQIKVDYLSEIKEKENLKLYLDKVETSETDKDVYHVIGKVNDKICFVSELAFNLNLVK